MLSSASDLAAGEDATLAEVAMDGDDGNAKAGNNMLQVVKILGNGKFQCTHEVTKLQHVFDEPIGLVVKRQTPKKDVLCSIPTLALSSQNT